MERTEKDETVVKRGLRRIETVKHAPMMKEGGGFRVRRPVGHAGLPSVGSFLMLDHFGPVTYRPGEAVGAPTHPHRGQMTVSYILDGAITHKDSMGNEGTLGPGWVQYMIAGAGVLHSEMPSEEILREGGLVEGFQLWVNLAPEHKFVSPHYQDVPPERIPEKRSVDGSATVKVLAGTSSISAPGERGAAETLSPVTHLDISWNPKAPNATHTENIPASFEGFAYCYRGTVTVNNRRLELGDCAVFSSVEEGEILKDVVISGGEGSGRVMLVFGTPVEGRVVRHGPFVMNTEEQIRQCYEDLENGKFGVIESAEAEREATKKALATQRANHKKFF